MIITTRPLSVLFTRRSNGSESLPITIGIAMIGRWMCRTGRLLTQTPATNCFPAVPINQNQCWTSRGKDFANTISLGSDMDIIPNLLGFRLQYTFSNGHSYSYCQR